MSRGPSTRLTAVAIVLALVVVSVLLLVPVESDREATGIEARTQQPAAAPPSLRGADTPPEARPDASTRAEPPESDSTWRLEIEVLDADGRPLRGGPAPGGGLLANATACFLPAAGGPRTSAPTDADGVAGLRVQGAGQACVFPVAPWKPWASDRLEPPPSGTRRIAVALTYGEEITGRVLDWRGGPLGGVQVRARLATLAAWSAKTPLWVWTARTETDGTFRIQGLGTSAYRLETRVATWLKGVDPGRAPPPPTVEAGTGGVEIRLLPPEDYHLRLRDAETGEPVTVRTQVYLRVDGEESWIGGVTGSDTREVMPPGPGGSIRVEAEGYEPYDLAQTEFVDASDERIVPVPLVRDPDGLVQVVLRIRDDAGRPVERVCYYRGHTMERGGKPVGWNGRDAACGDGHLELVLGAGRQHLKLGVPGLPHRDEPSADALRNRFLLPKQLALDVPRGSAHELDVVIEIGGAVRIRYPPGLDFGSFVREAEGDKAHHHAQVWYPGPDLREHYPIPAGAWELVILLDGAKHAIAFTVEKGRITEVTLDPDALSKGASGR